MRRRILEHLQRWIPGWGPELSPLLASAGGGGPLGPEGRPSVPGPFPLSPRPTSADPSDPVPDARVEPGEPVGPAPAEAQPTPAQPEPPPSSSSTADAPPEVDPEPNGPDERQSRPRRLAGKVKKGLISVVASSYDARADDLEERAVRAMRKALVDERSHILEVAREMYDARADDLQTRAVATLRRLIDEEHSRMLDFVQRTYDSRADDLEERAVRAMRSAIQREADRIESLIEHSVHVKRREVRLSLLVLVFANLIYLFVYWLTGSGGG